MFISLDLTRLCPHSSPQLTVNIFSSMMPAISFTHTSLSFPALSNNSQSDSSKSFDNANDFIASSSSSFISSMLLLFLLRSLLLLLPPTPGSKPRSETSTPNLVGTSILSKERVMALMYEDGESDDDREDERDPLSTIPFPPLEDRR